MNGLLGQALEALGYKVARLLCKVRWNKAPNEETTFTHVALRVTLPSGDRYGSFSRRCAVRQIVATVSLVTRDMMAQISGRCGVCRHE